MQTSKRVVQVCTDLTGDAVTVNHAISTCLFNTAVQRGLLQVRVKVRVLAGRTNLQERGEREMVKECNYQ